MASTEAKENQKARMKVWREENKERIAQYQKEWRARNAASVSEYQKAYQVVYKDKDDVMFKTWKRNLFRNYGMTPECFNALWQQQSGLCDVCKAPMLPKGRTSDAACVDHNHATGEVRGLLCRGCNHGIGCLKDSPKVLQQAIEYLEKRGNYSSLKEKL
jgi:Recombination endonuclease VII